MKMTLAEEDAMLDEIRNPILRGFYPDPSICRKGDDYYLVSSTFEYFPGVPIFHSKDLVHWHQIGHALTRRDQVILDGLPSGKGIYASTIRYNEAEDLFYMITTLVHPPHYWGNVNFFVTAKNPAGPWSSSVVIEGAEGIDPSLYFENGKAYYVGNLRPVPDDLENLNRHIWVQELDTKTGTLTGRRHIVLEDGAVHGAVCPEGPHIYKFGEYYYLLIAEGGTEHNHAVSVFRSKDIFGPYEINPRNPILTHRHLARNSQFNSIGHGDILETHTGEFWAVVLGARPDGHPMLRNLGRETFLVPVLWEEEWPVMAPETGKVEASYPAPRMTQTQWPIAPQRDHFDSSYLGLEWQILRTPEKPVLSLTERPGFLRLHLNPETVEGNASPAFAGRRQQHMSFTATTEMEFVPRTKHECAGIIVTLNSAMHMRLVRTLREEQDCLVVMVNGSVISEHPVAGKKLLLKASARYQEYRFFYSITPEEWIPAGNILDGSILSQLAYGFTGTMIALYASSQGTESDNHADFDWFEYSSHDSQD